MTEIKRKNRNTGLALAGVVAFLVIYSFVVVHTRGDLPEPPNLTKMQKILRGL